LKTSVASRTLDNITAVIVAFKNFRKSLKNENNASKSKDYSPDNLSQLFNLPNLDFTYQDIENSIQISLQSSSASKSVSLTKNGNFKMNGKTPK
jgi:hypothetical protein